MNWADYPIEFLPNQVYERNLNDLTNDLIEIFKKKCNFILQFLKSTATCSILISLKKSKIIKCVRQNNLENRTSYGQQ